MFILHYTVNCKKVVKKTSQYFFLHCTNQYDFIKIMVNKERIKGLLSLLYYVLRGDPQPPFFSSHQACIFIFCSIGWKIFLIYNFFSKVGEIFLAAGSSYSKLGRQPIQYNNRLRCVCPQMFVSCVNNKQLIKSKQNGTLNVLPRKKAATKLSQVNIIFLSPNPVCAFFIL